MQTVTPFLWFDDKAEDAARLYVSVIAGSSIVEVRRAGASGRVTAVTFDLAGRRHIAMNGGPMFPFTPAVSLLVSCETQDEVDGIWTTLVQGGEPQRCGWLKDRYGLSWQIVPTVLGELLGDADPVRAGRVRQAMMGMVKLDIAGLTEAAGSP